MAVERDLRSFVGANARRYRERAGLNQEQAADLMGVSPRYFRSVEAGQVNLTLGTLELLARALRVEAHQLLRPARLERRGPGRPRARARGGYR